METPLAMDSLRIRGFRAFDDLRVPRLGRVNLIVGKNNVGKSSFLEALWLYASQGMPSIMWQILEARDEGRAPRPSLVRDSQDQASVVKSLFYGRKDIDRQLGSIQIGPLDSADRLLTMSVGWYLVHTDEEGARQLRLFQFDDDNTSDHPVLCLSVRLG